MCKRNAVYLKSMNEHLQKTLPKIERDKRNEIKVSVLVAARNEEKNIRRCVQSLMNQSYSNYEVLVMNDNSTDSTEQILRELEKEHEFNEGDCGKKLFCHKNERLPANWYGKSWSVHCLAEKATGDILIITDADTMHSTDSIHFCVHSLITNDVQFLSGNFRTHTVHLLQLLDFFVVGNSHRYERVNKKSSDCICRWFGVH